MIRVDMQTIAKSGRNTSGVYIIKGDDVKSISRCPKTEAEEDEESEITEENEGTLNLE